MTISCGTRLRRNAAPAWVPNAGLSDGSQFGDDGTLSTSSAGADLALWWSAMIWISALAIAANLIEQRSLAFPFRDGAELAQVLFMDASAIDALQ